MDVKLDFASDSGSILRRGWVGVRVEHCYNLGAPPGGGGGQQPEPFKGSGSTQP